MSDAAANARAAACVSAKWSSVSEATDHRSVTAFRCCQSVAGPIECIQREPADKPARTAETVVGPAVATGAGLFVTGATGRQRFGGATTSIGGAGIHPHRALSIGGAEQGIGGTCSKCTIGTMSLPQSKSPPDDRGVSATLMTVIAKHKIVHKRRAGKATDMTIEDGSEGQDDWARYTRVEGLRNLIGRPARFTQPARQGISADAANRWGCDETAV